MRMPVAHCDVDLVVAGFAEGHQIAAIVGAALADGDDVMNLFHQGHATFLVTHLAERMLLRISIPDPFPSAAVLPVDIG